MNEIETTNATTEEFDYMPHPFMEQVLVEDAEMEEVSFEEEDEFPHYECFRF